MTDSDWLNAMTSHLAGGQNIFRRRTWKERLFSWPWRPWIDFTYVNGWVGMIMAHNDAMREVTGITDIMRGPTNAGVTAPERKSEGS